MQTSFMTLVLGAGLIVGCSPIEDGSTAGHAGTVIRAVSGEDDDGGSEGRGPLFRPFPDKDGKLQSATANRSLNGENKFFDPGLGTNGQACVSCHQPADGFDIHVETIQRAFLASNGQDPLFRTNDTADRPDANPADRNSFKLFLDFGVVRIGKSIPATTDFRIAPQDTPRFGPLPNANDPQAPGKMTLSLFRRPLVNTNVRFDSSVLWDGRASITDMRTQVKNAAKGLLLATTISDADADDVATFMLEVFTDQGFNSSVHAGKTSAHGATSGVRNLLALSSSPKAPCLFDAQGQPTKSITPALGALTPATCRPVLPNNPHTMNLFDEWAESEDDDEDGGTSAAGRASVARGQKVFNTVDLHVPGGGVIHCVTCHAVDNIGSNPDANFFVRLGTDSVQTLSALAAGDPRVQGLVDRVKQLPQYCLRPNSDPTSFTVAECGTRPGDVTTTDPGRALVSGQIADVGKFKPPVLRGFAARAPYFHGGAAIEDDDLVNFYNARFQIGLTDQQHNDLVAFLTSL